MIKALLRKPFTKAEKSILCVVSLVMGLFLGSCATMESADRPAITRLTVSQRITLPFKVAKCLWEERNKTMYILEQDAPNVYFYRDGKQIFSVGGFGNDKTNFTKLSDIAVDPDGNLLALDSFAKRVRKYTSTGMWIADIELQDFIQPVKLCSTTDGDLILYDAGPKELSRISGFDRKVSYSFGRFQINSASNVFCSRDFVLVTNEAKDATLQFSLMGQYIKSTPGQMGFDNYLYTYNYENGAVVLQNFELRLPFGWPNEAVSLMIDKTAMLLIHENEIVQFERTFGDR